MLASEVNRIIRLVIDKGCRNLGFHRTKRGGIGWYHPVDDHYFVITFRTPRKWNRHWGGFLKCRLGIWDQINPWIPELRRPFEYSIVSLASHADRETIRHWYNEAAALTTNPNPDGTTDDLTNAERKLSEMLRIPLQAPLSEECDNEFLLRFRTEEDVRELALFILQRIPGWMEKTIAQWRSWYPTSGRDRKPHQPFLDAIQADPDSDVPRLTYSDWLADRGDAWSEVIRIQCRYPDGYMPWRTADQVEDLINEHKHRFDRGADDLAVNVKFWRGMVEEIKCSAERFLKAGSRILETFPLTKVLSLYNINGRGSKLALRPELLTMRSLKLMDLSDDDWECIVRSPYLGRVEKLRVAFPRPINLALLLDMSVSQQLRALDLTGSRLNVSRMAALGETDAVSKLETLALNETELDDEMAQCLSNVSTLRDLKRLSVVDNPRLGINGIASLLNAKFAPQLELLAVGSGWIGGDLVQLLAESQLSSTIHLWLKGSNLHVDKATFKERFPNYSFGDNPIGRHL